jgi:branched-chain amino acid transport system ATP-binding protein/branched-chain amino acid transport system permease protein
MFFQAEGLVKAFGALRAVDDVGFAVTQGEILGIAGPNGSGKSTLFNIITNIPFRADAGRVVFEGHSLQHRTGHAISRLGLARTFQRESIFPSLSAIDNVLTAVEHSHAAAGRRGNERRAEAALELVGFPATMHNSLSGNLPIVYRKLVMIAAALALEPRLLLLDEPAASLTPAEIERVRTLILRLRAQGMTIVLIEHVLPLLTSVSDRLLVLDRGKVISQGAPAAVVADPLVVEAYLGVAGT